MRLLWIASNEAGYTGPVNIPETVTLETAGTILAGVNFLRNCRLDAAIVNLPFADWTAEEILEELQRANAAVPVIIRDPHGTIADAIRLVKLGAFHYLGGGSDQQELARILEAAHKARASREETPACDGRQEQAWRQILVGASHSLRAVIETIRLISARRCTALITGETGTGKEVAARAIHMASARAAQPLVAVNCSALPESLLEAELFGHVKGAFTGAIHHRVGRFEQAHRGTLFLDEIGDMPLELQVKLLRVLQEREFQRIGSSETIRVDVRVIAASNVNLEERIHQRSFREDLYYRLNVVPLVMPPLRERLSDIPPLVHHFVEKICRQEEIPVRQVTPETIDRLCRFGWPGNVRQLENAVEMAVALSGDREILYPGDFRLPAIARMRPTAAAEGPMIAVPDDELDFEQTVGRIARSIIEQALRKTGGNKKQAAEMLRLKRTTLAAKMKSLAACA